MARIRRWREVVLVWFTLFASLVWAGSRSSAPEARSGDARSLLVTSSGGKRAWGIALSAARPFLHTFSASALPIVLPAPVAAFATSAVADPMPAPPSPATSCYSCNTRIAPLCSTTTAICCNGEGGCTARGTCGCWSITCDIEGFSGVQCQTCDLGTCSWCL